VEIKTEADSNDTVECTYDDVPSTGMMVSLLYSLHSFTQT